MWDRKRDGQPLGVLIALLAPSKFLTLIVNADVVKFCKK
jgi:hypothetical protein